MAKVVGPLHSSEARGSVSSLTYNTWRGISTVKARAGPTTQYSAAQVAIRAKAALATASWKTLTNLQREAWKDYANQHTDIDWTGNPQRLSAYNWYVRINVRRQLLNQGIGTAPPVETCLLRLRFVLGEYYPPFIDFTWDTDPEPPVDQYFIEIYYVGPHSAGASPNIKAAHRETAIAYELKTWRYWTPPAGTHTFWFRPVRINGITAAWMKDSGSV